jgi:hypothetical protein
LENHVFAGKNVTEWGGDANCKNILAGRQVRGCADLFAEGVRHDWNYAGVSSDTGASRANRGLGPRALESVVIPACS